MSIKNVIFNNVNFSYASLRQPLVASLTVHFRHGWTGVVGANGVGKSTILKLAAGLLRPDSGEISGAGRALYCRQSTHDAPDFFEELLFADDKNAHRVKALLNVENDWGERWRTLSLGERKRAQIAVALWRGPDILALDEPTNHLDSEAGNILFEALKSYKGVGLLVSHDRALLDGLCGRCLFVNPGQAVLRPGNYSEGLAQEALEDESGRTEYGRAKRELTRLSRESSLRRGSSAQADRKRSKKKLSKKDSDAREKIDRARVTGKDGAAGRRLRQMEGRLKQAGERLKSIKVKKTYELGVNIPWEKSRRNSLFSLDAASISMGDDRRLNIPALTMKPGDRIALTGRNGSGKTTLLRYILNEQRLPPERLLYIPQEIEETHKSALLEEIKKLPGDKLGRMMNIVSRLGSHPDRLIESGDPSPGETRKLMLASGMAGAPHLIIMDEPTNHMDLPSIECLENALAECECALLLVSHDRRFMEKLTKKRWRIDVDDSDGTGVLREL